MVIPRNVYFRAAFIREIATAAGVFFAAASPAYAAVSLPQVADQTQDPPEQEFPTDSVQRAAGSVGPGGIAIISANLTGGAVTTGTLGNATPLPARS
jgi:hypothetical protein